MAFSTKGYDQAKKAGAKKGGEEEKDVRDGSPVSGAYLLRIQRLEMQLTWGPLRLEETIATEQG